MRYNHVNSLANCFSNLEEIQILVCHCEMQKFLKIIFTFMMNKSNGKVTTNTGLINIQIHIRRGLFRRPNTSIDDKRIPGKNMIANVIIPNNLYFATQVYRGMSPAISLKVQFAFSTVCEGTVSLEKKIYSAPLRYSNVK